MFELCVDNTIGVCQNCSSVIWNFDCDLAICLPTASYYFPSNTFLNWILFFLLFSESKIQNYARFTFAMSGILTL